MKIILIHPYYETHIVTSPLGIGYLAGALLQDGHDVRIFDCVAHNIKNKELIEIIKSNKPDAIAITVMSMFYNKVIDLVRLIKQNIDAKIILGGPHVSALPEKSLIETGADITIIGEGENTIREVCDAIGHNGSFANIKGICYAELGGCITNEKRELIEDLDAIPFPAWNLIKPDEYPPSPHGALFKSFPVAPIISTRGCPYECIFCASKATWGHRLRKRSEKNFVDEMEYLVNEFGIKEFHIEDDNFTFSKKHAMSICEEIIRRNLDVDICLPNGVRIDKIDKELLNIMKKAGVYVLSFGIESGSQKILNNMGKNLDLSIVPKVIDMTKDMGIDTWGFFILNLPGETRETIEETIKLALKLKLDRAQFSNFVPMPGTEIFNTWYSNNGLDWGSLCYTDKAVYQNNTISPEEVTKLQKEAFLRFYFRPLTFYNFITKIKLKQGKWIMKRILNYNFTKVLK